MKSKDLVVVHRDNKEISRFLRALVAAGSVTVELGSDRFRLTATPEKITNEGRSVILGGPSVED